MRIFIFILLIIFGSTFLEAQTNFKKELEATRISVKPTIDGELNEPIWESTPEANDFIQIQPFNGKPATQRNSIKVLYNNNALFISAILYDTYPDSIFTILSARDDIGITDYFGITLDTYNDGLSSYGFYVTAAGVQVDLKIYEEDKDYDWDAVWESAVTINDSSWIVEMRIPYSAIRFPKSDIQSWGINMFRNIQRCREKTSWNFVDSKILGESKQAGQLIGIKDIEPPLRLSINPYIAGYVDNNSSDNSNIYSLKGGLDIKYGISESFTLDMMLIPDFGQIQSDDQILNLSPFETYYSEKRSFFKEGTEIFQKAGIFYSKRIGDTPEDFNNIDLDSNDVITKNPFETQLINATKVSGKTHSGWSIGSLNAITRPMNAEVTDTITGNTRAYITQPFTNYNITSINKSLPNSSYISLINTNMAIFDGGRMANVTGTDFKFANKSDNYAMYGKGALSMIYTDDQPESGHYYDIAIAKIRGNFQFKIGNKAYSDTYNPNDLGFNQMNNIIINHLKLGYNIYKPFGRFLEMQNSLMVEHKMIYNPNNFYDLDLNYTMFTTFLNHLSMFIRVGVNPLQRNDVFEPRVANRIYRSPENWNSSIYLSSDYRKKLAIDFQAGTTQFIKSSFYSNYLSLKPRIRINDKILLIYTYEISFDHNAGYVSNTVDDVYFGSRHRQTINNTLNLDYIFTKNSGLSFRLRHYWSMVEYDQFFMLNDEGYLDNFIGYSENEDLNFNAFNIDMAYKWNFLPGSEISIVWKNSIYANGSILQNNYFENFENTLNNPQINSLSIRVLYYLDASYVKGI